jgi:hypothetical protein
MIAFADNLTPQFHMRDRVRLNTPQQGIGAGALGVVGGFYRHVDSLALLVCFDEAPGGHQLLETYLDLVAAA